MLRMYMIFITSIHPNTICPYTLVSTQLMYTEADTSRKSRWDGLVLVSPHIFHANRFNSTITADRVRFKAFCRPCTEPATMTVYACIMVSLSVARNADMRQKIHSQKLPYVLFSHTNTHTHTRILDTINTVCCSAMPR